MEKNNLLDILVFSNRSCLQQCIRKSDILETYTHTATFILRKGGNDFAIKMHFDEDIYGTFVVAMALLHC